MKSSVSMAPIVFLAAAASVPGEGHTAPRAAGCDRPVAFVALGTAGGPVVSTERSQPASLLVAASKPYLIDAGDGVTERLATAGYTAGALDTIFLSHLHLDHTAGLAGVIGLRWMNDYPGLLTIYGPPGTAEVVNGIIASMGPPTRLGFGIGSAPPRARPKVRVIEMSGGEDILIGDLRVRTARNSHFDIPGEPAAAGGTSLSFRFDVAGRSLTYTGDTGPSKDVTALAKGSDLLVSEVIDLDGVVAAIKSSRPDMPKAALDGVITHLTLHHLSPIDVGKLAAESAVHAVVMTHLSIPGTTAQAEPALLTGVARSYRGRVSVARDLAKIAIGCTE